MANVQKGEYFRKEKNASRVAKRYKVYLQSLPNFMQSLRYIQPNDHLI